MMFAITKPAFLPAITSIYCLLLISFRVFMTGNLSYVFLIWNLFLAWVPFIISKWIVQENKFNSFKNSILLCTWLAFFPNAPYLMTDLFHLEPKAGIPLWYDLILLCSFIGNGFLLGFLSLLQIHLKLNGFLSKATTWIFITVVMFLSGFGIYLGRYERWNSWDIVTNPVSLFKRIALNFSNSEVLPQMMGVTLFFGLFLLLAYLTFYQLSRGIKESL